MDLLSELQGKVYKDHEIPPHVEETSQDDPSESTESVAEEKFVNLLKARGFPMPTTQFSIDLNNGNYSVADFAWREKKLLVYIDGTSISLHGNPQTVKKDMQQRVMLKMQGWYIIEISYQALDDEQSIAVKLDELSMVINS
jgi:very-short-patch-repair endonuclease